MTPEESIERALAGWPIVLVACCAAKLTQEAPAEDLYTSDLFKKSRAYAEAFGAYWYVLSAKHGLIPSDRVIRPYDCSLTSMTRAQRADWNRLVCSQFPNVRKRTVVLLAGRLYREWADGRGYAAPLEGMGIGQQKAWLKAALANRAGMNCPLDFRAARPPGSTA